MIEVLITLAEKPTADYPLAVVVVYDAGKRGQEHLVRSVSDGRVFGNGLCVGARLGGADNFPANPSVDPRLIDVAA